MKLTPKQKLFADEYMICGNATEAARRAGYSEKYAGCNADKLLKNTKITAYMSEVEEQISSSRIADIKEVLEFYSAVMRGEVKDQFDNAPSFPDRLSAGKELMKRLEKSDDGKRDTLERLDNLLDKIGGVI